MAVKMNLCEPLDGKLSYVEFAGLSTDTKPTGDFSTGSIFLEVDSGKVYFYDEDGAADSEWVEQFSFQS